jgi:hypothetical protein
MLNHKGIDMFKEQRQLAKCYRGLSCTLKNSNEDEEDFPVEQEVSTSFPKFNIFNVTDNLLTESLKLKGLNQSYLIPLETLLEFLQKADELKELN